MDFMQTRFVLQTSAYTCANGVKVADRVRFVPQANRSLRTFNMHLNMPHTSNAFSWIPVWRKSYFAQRESHANTEEQRMPRSSTRMFSRRPFAPPIPPCQNQRGEIIFSSRVDPDFREGYERYRNAFERKRREKMEAQQRSQLGLWPFWRSSSSSKAS